MKEIRQKVIDLIDKELEECERYFQMPEDQERIKGQRAMLKNASGLTLTMNDNGEDTSSIKGVLDSKDVEINSWISNNQFGTGNEVSRRRYKGIIDGKPIDESEAREIDELYKPILLDLNREVQNAELAYKAEGNLPRA